MPIERWAVIVRGASHRPPIQCAHATCPTNLISECASFNNFKFIEFLKYLKLNSIEKSDRFRKFAQEKEFGFESDKEKEFEKEFKLNFTNI